MDDWLAYAMPSDWPTFDVTRDTISALPVSLIPTLGLSGVHRNRHSLLGVTAHDLQGKPHPLPVSLCTHKSCPNWLESLYSWACCACIQHPRPKSGALRGLCRLGSRHDAHHQTTQGDKKSPKTRLMWPPHPISDSRARVWVCYRSARAANRLL